MEEVDELPDNLTEYETQLLQDAVEKIQIHVEKGEKIGAS